MKGSGDCQERPCLAMQKEAISSSVFMETAAIHNWVRIGHNNYDSLWQARQAMLTWLDDCQLHTDHPQWMTQPHPDADYYLFAADDARCVLVKDSSSRDRALTAVNTVSTKAARKRGSGSLDSGEAPLSEELFHEISSLPWEQARKRVSVSRHWYERYAQRTQTPLGDESADRLVNLPSEAEWLSVAPAWADGAGRKRPVVLLSDQSGARFACTLQPNGSDPHRVVMTSCIPEQWAMQDLHSMNEQQLHISSRLGEIQAHPGRAQWSEDGAVWICPSGTLKLRPASSAQRGKGIRWVATEIHSSTGKLKVSAIIR